LRSFEPGNPRYSFSHRHSRDPAHRAANPFSDVHEFPVVPVDSPAKMCNQRQ